MTTYRQDLGAAQLRIAHLESELAARERTIRDLRTPPKADDTTSDSSVSDETTTTAASAPEAMSLFDAWPALTLAGIVIGYLVWHGAKAPDEVVSFALLLGAVASALLSLSKVLRWSNGGASSVGERVALVLGYILGAPFALGAFAFVMPIVGTAIAVGTGVVGIVGAAWWAWRFVVTGRD